MRRGVARATYTAFALAAIWLVSATPAHAQAEPQPVDDRATGERYVVEAAIGFWVPSAGMTISSESLGIVGSVIDFKQDLGLQDHRFPEFHFEAKGGGHKFRFQAIPIKYEQTYTVSKDIIFNGQRYRAQIPLTSSLDWKAYRFGYEYDFIRKSRGYGGFILDLKYTDVSVNLTSAVATEFARARAPIPAVGGVGRGYITPNISVTGEVTFFTIGWIPDTLLKGLSDDDDAFYGGHYVDLNIYGTFNFTNNIGVQAGYRSLDLGYLVDQDTGSFKLRGLFFGVVARY
jgi:hypothetical protein